MMTELLIALCLMTPVIDGVVISDCSSTNLENNPNIAENIVDISESLRTVYVQTEDGSKGYRIKLDSPYGNNLHFGDKVRVSVADGHTSVEVIARNTDVVSKVRHISELTDDDLYTYVTLEGVEFCKKEGAYLNINEKTVQITDLNKYIAQDGVLKAVPSSENADGWATMLHDDHGDAIYCLINSTCTWRRRGDGVPQGKGRLCGIIVPGELPRYGNPLGKYAIRPLDEKAFSFSGDDSSSYADICGWRWNFNRHAQMDFENAGEKRFVRPEEISGDRLTAETGKGFLYTDTGASLSLDDEFDARHPFDGWKPARMTGSRSYSALRLDCRCADFYKNGGRNGLLIETSLKDVQSTSLQLYFSFVASRDHSTYSENYPVEWQVSYSTDGVHFNDAGPVVSLCPMIFQNIQHGSRPAVVHLGCVPGFTEHNIALPASLCGAERLIVRLVPASDKTAQMPERYDGPWKTGSARNCPDSKVIIRFGDIVLSYLK